MTNKVAFALVFCALGFTALADPPDRAANTERIPFPPGGTIRFDHSLGDLHIEGWDRPEVEITIVKSVPGKQATQRLEGVRVTTERKSPSELEISTVLPHGMRILPPWPGQNAKGVMVEYQVHAPRNSKLVIHHGTGSVLVSGIAGDIEATGGRGDVMLWLPDTESYLIDAKTNLGTVSSDFDGVDQRQHLVGERFSEEGKPPSHRIFLRMGFGGITIKPFQLKPEMAAK